MIKSNASTEEVVGGMKTFSGFTDRKTSMDEFYWSIYMV